MDSLEQPGRAHGRRTRGWSGEQCRHATGCRGAGEGPGKNGACAWTAECHSEAAEETPGLNWEVQRDQGFPGGSAVKNPPAMQETWARSLGRDDPLEKEMATHSSILACDIPWTEEPGGLQSMGLQRVRHE